MRSLALAALVALLSGCSLNYVDTSFTALPKPEHMAEGEHEKKNDEKPGEVAPEGGPAPIEAETATTPAESSSGRTKLVFPPTAQPGK